MIAENTYEFIMPASSVTVTADVSRLPEQVERVEISGPAVAEQPPFMAEISYQYTARVLGNQGTEMEDRRIRWSMTPLSAPGVSLMPGYGTLVLERAEGMPQSITIVAEDVESGVLSEPFTVAIAPTEPFYNPGKIAASINSRYTREEFVMDLNAALEDTNQDLFVLNFNNIGASYTSRQDATVPSYRGLNVKINFPFSRADGANHPSIAPNPSAGTHFHYFNLSDKRVFTLDEILLGEYRPVAIGFVFCESTTRELPVDIVYSDGSTEQITASMSGLKNYFCGFKAPDGHFIKSFMIAIDNKWGLGLDEVGVILKEPDSLVVENEFPKLQWPKISEQPINRITKNLTLPETFGRCEVEWSSSDEGIINPVTGEVSKPLTPDNANVTLTATLKYGAITKDKAFKLKLPSLIEEDAEGLAWQILSPENINAVTKNLTLPAKSEPNDFDIVWQSSDPSVISTGGVVKRPSGKLDKMVVLTANIYHNNTKYIEKTFEVTVLTTQRDNTSKGGGGGGGGSRGTGENYLLPSNAANLPLSLWSSRSQNRGLLIWAVFRGLGRA